MGDRGRVDVLVAGQKFLNKLEQEALEKLAVAIDPAERAELEDVLSCIREDRHMLAEHLKQLTAEVVH